MANWVSVSVGVMADKDNERALYQLETMRALAETMSNVSYDESAKSSIWKFLENDGKSKEGLHGRGFIEDTSDIREKDTFKYFLIYTEDAWSPCVEIWEEIFNLSCYDELRYVLSAVGTEDDVMVNTDADGILFPERYLLDYCAKTLGSSEMQSDYVFYESFDELAADVERLFGVKAANFDDLYQKLETYSEDHEDDVELISPHEFMVVSPEEYIN